MAPSTSPIATGRTFAYGRVSTDEQELSLQLDAFTAAGIEADHVFTDKVSGAKTERPELDALLRPGMLREGDTLVVWRLDRLGRSLSHLLAVVEDLEHRGVAFRSLCENIDTSTPAGRFQFQVFGAMAEMERAIIRERTNAGLAAARARGRVGGRRPKLSDQQAKAVRQLYATGTSATELAETFGVARQTIYNVVRAA